MPIIVSCQCGKKFKAGDQLAGKRVRCPGCGNALAIPAKKDDDLLSLAGNEEVFQPAPVSAAAAPKAAAKAARGLPPLSKSKRDEGPTTVPTFTLSPMYVVLIVLAILIPSAIYWAKEGPMKAMEQWRVISNKAQDNITGQMTHAIEYHFKQMGFDVTDIKYPHKAISTFFDDQVMLLRLPDSVPFQGTTNVGHPFHGVFHPKTFRFEADLPIGDNTYKVTGSASDEDHSLDMDGKAVSY